MHRLVSTIRAEDRRAYVLLHLSPAQHTWSSRSLLVLQRGSVATPAIVPALDDGSSSLHCEATSECIDASPLDDCSVVGEDAVLMCCCVLHVCCAREEAGLEVWQRRERRCARGATLDAHINQLNERRKEEGTKNTPCMSRGRVTLHVVRLPGADGCYSLSDIKRKKPC